MKSLRDHVILSSSDAALKVKMQECSDPVRGFPTRHDFVFLSDPSAEITVVFEPVAADDTFAGRDSVFLRVCGCVSHLVRRSFALPPSTGFFTPVTKSI